MTNAIKFIKDQGVEKAREVVESASKTSKFYCYEFNIGKIRIRNNFSDKQDYMFTICLDDLKRLVESFDLIKSYGGISMAKRQCSCFMNACASAGVKPSPLVLELQQAIADYESIGGEHV